MHNGLLILCPATSLWAKPFSQLAPKQIVWLHGFTFFTELNSGADSRDQNTNDISVGKYDILLDSILIHH